MADLKIEITPQSVALMCAVRNDPIPQRILDQLGDADRIEAEKYNKDLELMHWHVRGSGIGYPKDIAFNTEQEAIDAEDMLWNWETGGDEDKEYKISYDKCHKTSCRVYVG